MFFRAGSYHFNLSEKVLIMGIINVTPDSFSDGGMYLDPEKAYRQAVRLVDEGADIVDVGAVSTRPGAQSVTEEEELTRILPVLKKICGRISAAVSVDTTSISVARKALDLGAQIINDVSGLKDSPGMARELEPYHAGLILMHRRGHSQNMQQLTQYHDVVDDVKKELLQSIETARTAGVESDSIVIDPGIGFSKTGEQNLVILRRLNEFSGLGFPVMIGTSKKSFIGEILKRDVSDRTAGSIATCIYAVSQGVNILRVHDVKETKDAINMTLAISERK